MPFYAFGLKAQPQQKLSVAESRAVCITAPIEEDFPSLPVLPDTGTIGHLKTR